MASVLTRSAQFGPRSEQGACKLALSTASLRIAENTFAAIGRDRWQASLGVGEVNLLASTSNEDERSRPNGPDREQQKSNCLWGGRTNQETQRRLTRGSSRRGPVPWQVSMRTARASRRPHSLPPRLRLSRRPARRCEAGTERAAPA
jgi:hypothetical protein